MDTTIAAMEKTSNPLDYIWMVSYDNKTNRASHPSITQEKDEPAPTIREITGKFCVVSGIAVVPNSEKLAKNKVSI